MAVLILYKNVCLHDLVFQVLFWELEKCKQNCKNENKIRN